MSASDRHGFTLIELSVVLAIIGLLVGGILVASDLIKAAEIRGHVQQIEKYNAAANTFRSKYGGLPGDLLANRAAAFGFFAVAPQADEPWGNGDGLIISSADGDLSRMVGESGIFWIHLSEAKLMGANKIDQYLISSGNMSDDAPVPADYTAPRARLGRDNHIYIYAGTDAPSSPQDVRLYRRNYFHMFPYATLDDRGYINATENGITPIEAYAIDSKMDDGKPNTGKAVTRAVGVGVVGGKSGAFPNRAPSAAGESTPGKCNVGDGLATTDTYNVKPATGGNEPTCSLRIRAAF